MLNGLHRAAYSQDVQEKVELVVADATGEEAVTVAPFHVLHEMAKNVPLLIKLLPEPVNTLSTIPTIEVESLREVLVELKKKQLLLEHVAVFSAIIIQLDVICIQAGMIMPASLVVVTTDSVFFRIVKTAPDHMYRYGGSAAAFAYTGSKVTTRTFPIGTFTVNALFSIKRSAAFCMRHRYPRAMHRAPAPFVTERDWIMLCSITTALLSEARSTMTIGVGLKLSCDTLTTFPTMLSREVLTNRTFANPSAALNVGDKMVSTTNG